MISVISISLSSHSLGSSMMAFELVRGPNPKALLAVKAGNRVLLGLCKPCSRWTPPLLDSTIDDPYTNLPVKTWKSLSWARIYFSISCVAMATGACSSFFFSCFNCVLPSFSGSETCWTLVCSAALCYSFLLEHSSAALFNYIWRT